MGVEILSKEGCQYCDMAVELCKDFVDDSSHGLVNSVLQKLHDEKEGKDRGLSSEKSEPTPTMANNNEEPSQEVFEKDSLTSEAVPES